MASLDSILSRYVTESDGHVNSLQGAAFIVTDKNGDTVYSKALGKQKFTADSPPFTEDTVCWIASMSKLITSICALQCVEKGLIALDDDVAKFIPELSNMDVLEGFTEAGTPILTKQTNPITLRHLLTHSSGLAYDIFDPDLQKWSTATGRTLSIATADTLEAYLYPLKFQPGTSWTYGIGLDWAGHLVEVLTSTTLESHLQRYICAPTGMSSTTLHLASRPDLAARRAEIGHRQEENGTLLPGPEVANTDRKAMGGGGGIFSTASDYAQLLHSLLTNDGRILEPETTDLLFAPTLSPPSRAAFQTLCDGAAHDMLVPEFPAGTAVDHGLGGAVNLEDVGGKRRAGSGMWSGMTNPHWFVDGATGVAAVLMVQVLGVADGVVIKLYDELERALYKDLVAEPVEPQA